MNFKYFLIYFFTFFISGNLIANNSDIRNELKNSNNYVTSICGEYYDDNSSSQIEDDSEYVFTPDPSFESIILYDVEGNAVTVNSYKECSHYIKGNWIYDERTDNSSEIIVHTKS